MKVLHLYRSPAHNYFGHHGQPAGTAPVEACARFECVAGKGIVGDRFFDWKPDYKGQITFFAHETYHQLCAALQIWDRPPSVFRRNVILEGVPLLDWVGDEFEIQGVRFLGTEEARPCAWMNEAFGPGAEELLRGQGGLRAKILSSGWLQTDPA